jgi:uncharacterized protein YbjT (DUF2867 family)
MILVTGATGAIGRYLVRQLLQEEVPFRALVRDAARGRSLRCEYVVGDFDAPDTLRAALVGADRLLLNGSVHVAMAEQQKRAVDAAAQAGVAYIKPVTYVDQPVEFFVDALRARGVPEPVADSFDKMMRRSRT